MQGKKKKEVAKRIADLQKRGVELDNQTGEVVGAKNILEEEKEDDTTVF